MYCDEAGAKARRERRGDGHTPWGQGQTPWGQATRHGVKATHHGHMGPRPQKSADPGGGGKVPYQGWGTGCYVGEHGWGGYNTGGRSWSQHGWGSRGSKPPLRLGQGHRTGGGHSKGGGHDHSMGGSHSKATPMGVRVGVTARVGVTTTAGLGVSQQGRTDGGGQVGIKAT